MYRGGRGRLTGYGDSEGGDDHRDRPDAADADAKLSSEMRESAHIAADGMRGAVT